MFIPALQSDLPLEIRPVNPDDASDLHRMCWSHRSYGSIVEMLERTEKLTRYRRGLAVVAQYGSVTCGFGMLTMWPGAAEISDLIVNEAYRGHGIGSRIITTLTQAACDIGVVNLEIGVALTNTRAMDLYKRLGFCEGRIIELDLGDGPELVMYLTKKLTEP